MNQFVSVKKGENTLKIKVDRNLTELLSRIFKLKADTIYLIGEDSVIMPDPATGEIKPEDVVSYITYEVFGEPAPVQPSQFQMAQQGPSGIRRNPPVPLLASSQSVNTVAVGNNPQPSSPFRPPHGLPNQPYGNTFIGSQRKTWRRAIMFCEVVDGSPSPLFQVFLTLSNETATVESITEKVEQEAGVPVILVDNKHLPIRSSESTKGSFWHGVRKIFAIPASQGPALRGIKRKSDESAPTEHEQLLLSEMKKIREDLAAARANSANSDQGVIQDSKQVKSFLEKVFKCTICYSVVTLPSGVCSECHQFIGCIHCIEQWREEGNSVCPLCRSDEEYEKVPVIRQLQEPLSKISTTSEEDN